jgi:methyltransferase
MSRALFGALLAAVMAGRLIELGISRRHRAALAALGAEPAADPVFPWMAALHVAVLVGAGVEVWALDRAFVPALGVPMMALVALATLLRWWVMRTLGTRWNVRVMSADALGVVTSGPYRWVRHPNYLAVLVELAALPLVHGAWLTALVGSTVHAFVLHRRIGAEEAVLSADPIWRTEMASKPRFFPRRLLLGR